MSKLTSNDIVGCVCVIASAVVACSGHDGWGWMLLMALLIFVFDGD